MKSVLVACLLLASLVAPLNAAATHELPDPVETLREAAAGVSRTVGNNAPVFMSSTVTVDRGNETWQIGCGPAPLCFFTAGGPLHADTHVGPVDTAACPVLRGEGSGVLNPPGGTFGGPYDAAELHDLRVTITGAGVLLEGAWRDEAGRGDRFVAQLTTQPVPASAAPCPGTTSYSSFATGAVWALGFVR